MRGARILRQEGLDSAALGKARAKPVAAADTAQLPSPTDDGVLPDGDDTLESLPIAERVTSPAGRVVPDHPAAADPELVKAWFAAGEFEEVAAELPALLANYWSRVRRGESLATMLADEPAYLAAIAARTFVPAARAFVPARIDWLGLVGDSLFDSGSDDTATIYGQIPIIQAMEVLLRQIPNRTTLSSALVASQITAGAASALRTSPSRLPNDWKIVLAGAMAQQPGEIYDVPLSLAALPFLGTELVDLLRAMGLHSERHARQLALPQDADEIVAFWKLGLPGKGRDAGWQSVLRPAYVNSEIAYEVAGLLNILDVSDLSGVSRLASAVAGIAVTFDLAPVRGSGARLIGLVPEFYAPIRSAFEAELSPVEIASLVGRVTEFLRRWPTELEPASFENASADRRKELLPLLIAIADYHGCLGDLVRTAAASAGVQTRIGRVAKLFAAFETAWAL